VHLGCFVMMRNESPIIEPFLDQLQEFFDCSVVLDHESTDDSAERVAARKSARIVLYHLKAAGYPQSEVATYFARELLRQQQFDYLFFLDCDEFLPFSNRAALEEFLHRASGADVLRLRWVNVCPSGFEGDNIFARPFDRNDKPSPFPKVILRSTILQSAPDFVVLQGYHAVSTATSDRLRVEDAADAFLIHIPLQSRVQISFKLANGHNRLVRERVNLTKRQGFHWVDLAGTLARGTLSDDALRTLALNYPYVKCEDPLSSRRLEFEFPYVKTQYAEPSTYVAAHVLGLLQDASVRADDDDTGGFVVTDSDSNVIVSSAADSALPKVIPTIKESVEPRALPLAMNCLAEDYSRLIEPLFCLPTKMPATAWGGHVPFLFVLFKLLSPRSYVELGVHNGASFIAACTAARTYNLHTKLIGIDNWQGDDHTGRYEGDRIYSELKTYIEGNFRNAELKRCFFAEARRSFATSSIDVLHIDGLHTYDAVKEDFKTWFKAVSSNGIVLFHDICVYEKGFGVHRLWTELKKHFSFVEFYHSYGLGVLLMNPSDPRLESLLAVVQDVRAMALYRELIAAAAGTIPERLGYFDAVADRDRALSQARAQLDALYRSTSWKITAPLRALRRFIR
jgi:hypothetical protein